MIAAIITIERSFIRLFDKIRRRGRAERDTIYNYIGALIHRYGNRRFDARICTVREPWHSPNTVMQQRSKRMRNERQRERETFYRVCLKLSVIARRLEDGSRGIVRLVFEMGTFHLRSCPKDSGLIKLIRRMAAAWISTGTRGTFAAGGFSKEKRPYLRRLDKRHDGRYA